MATKDSNPTLPLEFKRGQNLRAADLEEMRSAIAFALDGMIGAGPGLLIAKRGSKWIISLQRNGVSAEPKTFFTTAADAGGTNKVKISAGSMGPVMVPETELAVGSGSTVALKVTFNADGSVITAAEPVIDGGSNTATIAYFPLAGISVVSGNTVVVPTAWNYSWAQACGVDGDGNIVANPW